MAMTLIPSTITKVFEGKKRQFVIPIYQRAYSWEENQLEMFLNDLLDQNINGNPYNLGNILVEKTNKEDTYEIIDGQQRLTTVVIFMRSLINVLVEKEWELSDDASPEEIFNDFIKIKHNVKLKTVNYDNEFFDFVIVKNENGGDPITQSQRRILYAKEYFEKKLIDMDINKLQHLYTILTKAEISWLETEGKTESALLFELQNNRGVQLTILEKIKSFFMYQVYQKTTCDITDSIVDKIAEHFDSIYSTASKINGFSEEEVFSLSSHFITREFRTINMGKIMKETKKSPDVVEYILDFSAKLSQAFNYVLQIEKINNNFKLNKIREYRFNEAYPFLMIAKNENMCEDEFFKTINILEILMFRIRLINTRADFRSRLQRVLKEYDGRNCNKLIRNIETEFSYYWGSSDVKRQLRNMRGNVMFHYIVMEYENSLSPSSYDSSKIEILLKEQEHIAPQNPKSWDYEGYDFDGINYSENFSELGLNSIGNFTVLPKNENLYVSNKNFSEKLDHFDQSILIQHREIRNFASELNGELMWDIEAVNRRADKISDFVMEHWDFKKC